MSFEFKVVNDVIQRLPWEGHWVHHATIIRQLPNGGCKEYVVFSNGDDGQTYLEEVTTRQATFQLVKIKDDREWADLFRFCREARLFDMSGDKKLAT